MTLLAVLDSDSVSAGPLGFFIVVLLLVATVLLIKSMGSRLRNLPREFPDHRPDADEGPEQR